MENIKRTPNSNLIIRDKISHIGIGTAITDRPSHTTVHTDRVYGDSADQGRIQILEVIKRGGYVTLPRIAPLGGLSSHYFVTVLSGF